MRPVYFNGLRSAPFGIFTGAAIDARSGTPQSRFSAFGPKLRWHLVPFAPPALVSSFANQQYKVFYSLPIPRGPRLLTSHTGHGVLGIQVSGFSPRAMLVP